MYRIKTLFVFAVFLAFPGTAGCLAFAQEKGFSVEEKPEEVLEKNVGVRERYALLIGISEYANPTIDLNFAANDAEALHELLLDPEIGGYDPENVRLLTDADATRRNIMSALNSWLGNRVREEDSVLVFYSGHGALGNGSDAYWVTHDADVEDLYASAMSNKEISSLLDKLPAKRKITLIDSCYSEATAKKYRALVPGDVFEEFKGEGSVTITASTGQEKSVEVGGHGAFTYHLLDGLAGKADNNNNGVVEIDEVWSYLNEKVRKTAADAGNRQTPVLLADRLEHGFPLTINPARAAGATLAQLKQLYSDAAITVAEIGEAEQLFTTRGGSPELRKLYRDLAAGVLTPEYFRRLRQVQGGGAPRPASSGSAVGASSIDREAYGAAEEANQIESWNQFLQIYPNSPLATDARARLAALKNQEDQRRSENVAYDIARASDGVEGWQQFVTRFPVSPRATEARNRIAALQEINRKQEMEPAAFILAESQNTEEGWANFIKQFPASQLAVIAQSRLAQLRKVNREQENGLYAQALQTDAASDWGTYIKEYPDGRFIEEAMKKRTGAIRREQEQAAYTVAANSDTVDQWNGYLEKYAQGSKAAEARTRIEQLTWLAFADLQAVPGGAFTMGNPKGKGEEKPPHRIELSPFQMGRTEVANAQYLKFMEETGRQAPSNPSFAKDYMRTHPDLPVVKVSYADADAFCGWLSGKTGATVRLPTEAEWEYAAASGRDNYRYPWGTSSPKEAARYNGNDPSGVKTVGKTAFPPNEFGLHNMSGNVAEWTSDYYSNDYYKSSPRSNPTGPDRGKERVVRGGSWDRGEDELRVSRRYRLEPKKTEDDTGFRIVVQ